MKLNLWREIIFSRSRFWIALGTLLMFFAFSLIFLAKSAERYAPATIKAVWLLLENGKRRAITLPFSEGGRASTENKITYEYIVELEWQKSEDARICIIPDDYLESITVNGQLMPEEKYSGKGRTWPNSLIVDFASYLREGNNEILIRISDCGWSYGIQLDVFSVLKSASLLIFAIILNILITLAMVFLIMRRFNMDHIFIVRARDIYLKLINMQFPLLSQKSPLMPNSSVYTAVFVCVTCILFLFFVVGIIQNPAGSQRQIFFRGMDDFFADHLNVLRYIADRDPYFNPTNGTLQKIYFPLSYFILYPFSQLDTFNTMTLQEAQRSKMGLMSAFAFIGFSVSLLFMSLKQIIRKFLISPLMLISLVLSYIFFFSVERGNTIILVAAFVGFFICYYDSEDKYKRILAMVFLALAATLKIYPALFGLLYFEKKQYREIFGCSIITLLFVFVPFLFFKRGFDNIPQLYSNMQLMTDQYNFTGMFPRFSLAHLVYCASPLLKFSKNLITSLPDIVQIITYFMTFVSIAFSCLVKNKWLKISLLSMTIVFLPVNSGLYCGLYLFPVIVLFFASLQERSKIFNIFTVIVFVIFLNPYQIIINNVISNYHFANIALFALWLVLLASSGRQIIGFLKNKRIVQE
jgi:hypothetical protein